MTQYTRGRAKEWAVCKELRARGWQAVRSAGSHGYFDVTAVAPTGYVYLIQVKYYRGGGWKDKNFKQFSDMPCIAFKQVWLYTYGTKEPEIIDL